MENEIKKLSNEKNFDYKLYCCFNRDVFLFKKFPENKLDLPIEKRYYSKLSSKSVNPATSSKRYWSLLKIFVNNKTSLCIPPRFLENKFITNFWEKAELFNTVFANQYSLLNNSSAFFNNEGKITKKSLGIVNFWTNHILMN